MTVGRCDVVKRTLFLKMNSSKEGGGRKVKGRGVKEGIDSDNYCYRIQISFGFTFDIGVRRSSVLFRGGDD